MELTNQDKSNVFMQAAVREVYKGEKVVMASSKNGWALLVVAAGPESLRRRSSTNTSLRSQSVQANGEELKYPAFKTLGCRWASLRGKKKTKQWFSAYLCLQRKATCFNRRHNFTTSNIVQWERSFSITVSSQAPAARNICTIHFHWLAQPCFGG